MLNAASDRDTNVFKNAVAHKQKSMDEQQATRDRKQKRTMVSTALSRKQVLTSWLNSPAKLSAAVKAAASTSSKKSIITSQLKLWRDCFPDLIPGLKHIKPSAKDAPSVEVLVENMIAALPKTGSRTNCWDQPTTTGKLKRRTLCTTDLGEQTQASKIKEEGFEVERDMISAASEAELIAMQADLKEELRESRPKVARTRRTGAMAITESERLEFKEMGWTDADLIDLTKWRRILKVGVEFFDEHEIKWTTVGVVGGDETNFLVECRCECGGETEDWVAQSAYDASLGDAERENEDTGEEDFEEEGPV